MGIKNKNIENTAMIEEHKLNIGGESTGVNKFYVGTDGTQAYELAATRVPQDRLFTGIDAAINATTASRGDKIYVLPNHTESITAASGITQDVAGVQVIGLGEGSMRPRITWASTDNSATWVISAASCAVKNIVGICGDDGLTSAFVISAADCTVDVEWRDGSATVEAASAILTTAAADRLNLKLKYLGYAAGNACVSPIKLIGVDNANIVVDFYGVASTSIVEFHTTACSNVNIIGYFNNVGTSLTKNVVDTATGSTWKAAGWDGAASAWFSGGDNAALAVDDTSAIATLIGTANATTTDSLHGKIGTDTQMADRSMFDLLGGDGFDTAFPTAAVPAADVSIAEVLRDVWDAVRNGTGGTEPATNKSIIDALGFNGSAFVAGGLAKYLPQCVAKSDGAVLSGNDDIFTVVGTVRCKIVGLVTTVLGGAANGRLKMTTTVPSATIDLNAGAVAIDTDAAGTIYHNLGATSVFTPSSTLGYVLLDPVTVEETEFILTDGTVHFNSSAAQSGVIAWYCTYTPLTPGASVTAAA